MAKQRPTRPPESPYSKVVRTTWGDKKFQGLSPLRPSGQALWLYLLTGPHCTVIPGLFPKMGIGTLADALRWPYPAVARTWTEVVGAGMAECDWTVGVIWLPKAIDHNAPANPNVVTSWRAVPLPQCDLVTRALRSLRAHLAAKPDPLSWVKAFDDVFRKGFPEAFREPLGERIGNTGSRVDPSVESKSLIGSVQTVEKSAAVRQSATPTTTYRDAVTVEIPTASRIARPSGTDGRWQS